MAIIKQIEVAGTTYDIRDEYSHYVTKDVNNLTNYTKTADLATVATTGSYNNLIDKPTIPASTKGSLSIQLITGPGASTTTTYEAYSDVIGTTVATIDLSIYAKEDNMPIATNNKAGCMKIDSIYATTFSSSSALKGQTLNYSQYTSGNSDLFVSKGTLENVIVGKNVVLDASYVHTDNNYTTTEKTKLTNIAAGAQVNQNAFSTITIGAANVQASTSTDSVTLVAGNNITLTANTETKTITLAAVDTTYSSQTAEAGGSTLSLVTTGEKYTWNNKSDFSGSYADLSNTPVIPGSTSDLINDSGFITNSDITTYLTSISGYSSSATQTLKNINGTLTWVTDTI